MTKIECEAAVLKKLLEIEEICKQYNPDGNYISMCILNGHYSVNNDYQEADKDHPLNAWYRPDEFVDPYSYSREFERTVFNIETCEVVEDAT